MKNPKDVILHNIKTKQRKDVVRSSRKGRVVDIFVKKIKKQEKTKHGKD